MVSETGGVIDFPGTREKVGRKTTRQITNIDGMKYYTDRQIKLVRRTVQDQAALDLDRGQITGGRKWMAVDPITSIGMGRRRPSAELVATNES